MNTQESVYQERASKSPTFQLFHPFPPAFPSPLETPKSVLMISYGPEDDDGSGEFQSMVVADDFDVEEELYKAQKEGTNAFKVLSMCFYERSKTKPPPTKQNKPFPVPQLTQLPLQELPLKSNSSPREVGKIIHRSNGKGTVTGSPEVKTSQGPLSDRHHLTYSKENHHVASYSRLQTAASIQANLKGVASGGYLIPGEQVKSPRAHNDVKEIYLAPREETQQGKGKNGAKIETENTNSYYFSILKHKYASPQKCASINESHRVQEIVLKGRDKNKEEVRPGTTMNSSREIRASGIPVTKVIDLKEQVRQSQDIKNIKEARETKGTKATKAPTKATGMNQGHHGHLNEQLHKDMRYSLEVSSMPKSYRVNLVTLRDKEVNSSRLKTEKTFDSENVHTEAETPLLEDNINGDDHSVHTKKPIYEKTKKIVEAQKMADHGQKRNNKEKETVNRHTFKLKFDGKEIREVNNSKLRSSSRLSHTHERETEGTRVLTSRREKDERSTSRRLKEERPKTKGSDTKNTGWLRTKNERLYERKDTSGLLDKSSEPKRQSLDPFELHRSGSQSSRVRLKINMDTVAKDRYEIEANPLSLREYSSKMTKERVPGRIEKTKGNDKRTYGGK